MEEQSEAKEETRRPRRSTTLKAKKDFVIHHNDYHRDIKEGDDLKDVPKLYIDNLKTEGVL